MTTKAESEWMDDICELGCIVCWNLGFPHTPAVPHHLLRGGRRIDHLHTIPLCDPGHHQNGDGGIKISRHPYRVRFERAYGTEPHLLEETQQLVVLMRARRALGLTVRAA